MAYGRGMFSADLVWRASFKTVKGPAYMMQLSTNEVHPANDAAPRPHTATATNNSVTMPPLTFW
eukprot:scaffold309595_cov35-Attheya_sp.AAC.1